MHASDIDRHAPWSERLQFALMALLVGLIAALLASPAGAAAPLQPVLELSVHKVVVTPGQPPERLEAAEAARAGDTLEYEAVYRNPTAQTVRNAQITLPVPGTGVEYLKDSGLPPPQSASADGKKFAALPLMRTEAGADGKPVQRPAPAADYRFLRWGLGDIAPGAVRTVRARVQLLPVGSAR